MFISMQKNVFDPKFRNLTKETDNYMAIKRSNGGEKVKIYVAENKFMYWGTSD